MTRVVVSVQLRFGSRDHFGSWIASLNYVRNVAAHHARLFNRKLVVAPKRPAKGHIPLLDLLKGGESSKRVFGLYNGLAVKAYLLQPIDPDCGWAGRVVSILEAFSESEALTIVCVGAPVEWPARELWQG